MKKSNHHAQADKETPLLTTVKLCSIFSLVFFAIAIALLLALSLIFIKFENSTDYISLTGKLSLYLSAFLSSILLARKSNQDTAFPGFLFGSMITGLIFLASLVYPQSTQNSVIWLIIIPVTTVLGSIIGKKRNKKKFKYKQYRK